MIEVVDAAPIALDIGGTRHVCQGWRCTRIAVWNRWAGFYCYDHAIRAGWLPGPVIRPFDQLAIRAA